MKKNLFCFFIFITALAYGQDFRNVTWNMQKIDVSKLETATPIETSHDDVLNYSVDIADYSLTLQYLFVDNLLYGASYFRDITNNNIINSYNNQKVFFDKMLDLLSMKYGKGELISKENDILVFYDFKNKSIKKYVNDDIESFLDINETNNSIQLKHLDENIFNIGYVYCVKFKTNTTVILLWVQQKGSEIHQEIMYMSNDAYAKINGNILKQLTNDSGL
jgi:hypothetical protein